MNGKLLFFRPDPFGSGRPTRITVEVSYGVTRADVMRRILTVWADLIHIEWKAPVVDSTIYTSTHVDDETCFVIKAYSDLVPPNAAVVVLVERQLWEVARPGLRTFLSPQVLWTSMSREKLMII